MRELKDQLCTLLVTFQDDKEPNKEITTAHTFASTKQEDYPQYRRIVHSRHTDRDESGRPLSVTERLSQSSLSASIGPLGSDMVEHRRALSSPPFSVTVSPNSPNIEKPKSVPQINTQRQYNSISLPRSVDPLLTIHEVSLAYTSPKSTTPTSAPLQEPTFPNNTLPGLLIAKNKQTAPATITTFPTSGSVHILLPPKEANKTIKINGKQTAKTMNTKLPYVVKRPEGDWAYNRSNGQLQISDKPQKSGMERQTSTATSIPTRGEGGTTGDAETSIIPVRVLQQQKTKKRQ
uniref:Uncharacterized protein n=1 Tax=Meloidogyne enterolobii TaxID=390850 RepID=A0A6V7V290_MELEN|nr:unnamed protein product [Meloidogyne enterolobii]